VVARKHADQRLTAILAADVVGYSRLMEADERATLSSLDASRAVFQEHVTGHGGRIFDTAGDSVLAVLQSAIGAVEAAIAIQDELYGRNESLPEDQRMHFRLGVNLGDVIEKDDGSVYGSGVNVAARLENLADPGGICISDKVQVEIEGKLDLGTEFIGEHEVKNIARPVRAFRVNADPAAQDVADTAPPLALPDKPSIAVLPFTNLGGDPQQEYFADGIAEDLITALSCIRWLFVTARNSTFAYKGQSPDVRRVGKDLGVHYVVEGSVRKGGERVRITAQLVDAATGNHIWAEHYDRNLSDIFALQDEISETMVAALQGEVGEFERERAHRKPPESLDAWESYQRGMWHLWRYNAKDMAEARRLFQRAADLDPHFAQAVAALGFTLFVDVILAFTNTPLETLEQALRFANQAVALDDKEAMAHHTFGRVQTLRGEYDAAIAELRTAIDLNPSSAMAHNGLGMAFWLTGQLDEAISEYDTAIRLSPRDPGAWGFYNLRAQARFFMGDYEAAVEDARSAIMRPSAKFHPHPVLASALALLDRREEAKIALDKLLEIKPDFSPNDIFSAFSPLNPEALRPRFKTWIDGLRKAGLDIPDELTAAD